MISNAVSSVAPVSVLIVVSVGASFTLATVTCTCTAVEDASEPSYALTVNALSVPLAFDAGVHWSFSPVPTVVVPAVTAAHAEPVHFESVPVLTASIRNESGSLSASAASDAAKSVAYVISNAVSSVAPVSVLTLVSVGAARLSLRNSAPDVVVEPVVVRDVAVAACNSTSPNEVEEVPGAFVVGCVYTYV